MVLWGRSGGLPGTTWIRSVRATNFRKRAGYLVHNVFERVGAVDGEANKDDVGFWVGQRSQTVVLFLPRSVPQGELNHLACGQVRRLGDVVLEDCGHIFLRRSANCKAAVGVAVSAHLWEVAGAVADQQTCLPASAITHDDQLLGEGGRFGDGGVICLRCSV